jgi:hypothetical protein
MQDVTLQPIPSQSLSASMGNQAVALNIYQTAYGLFMDVFVNGSLIIGGVLCLNLTRIVRDLYLGFSGDLIFLDTQGTTDPVYTRLGSRYSLIYLSPSDLPSGFG